MTEKKIKKWLSPWTAAELAAYLVFSGVLIKTGQAGESWAGFMAQSAVCLAFLADSWYEWFRGRSGKNMAKRVGRGLAQGALLSVLGTAAGWMLGCEKLILFWQPFFLMVELAAFSLILAVTVLRDRRKKK